MAMVRQRAGISSACVRVQTAHRNETRTTNDAARFVEQIRTGETEIRFVPQGATYFKNERWEDENEEITADQINDARLADEIARARASDNVGGELDPDSETLARLEADG